LLLAGCDLLSGGGPREGDYTVAEAEAFLGAPFPPQATDVRVFSEAGIDRIVYARFALPPDQIGAYLTALGLPALEANLAPFTLNTPAPVAWWTPDQAKSYAGTQRFTPKKTFQVVVDTTDPARSIVYVRAFEL
jgi:hypothetical protein